MLAGPALAGALLAGAVLAAGCAASIAGTPTAGQAPALPTAFSVPTGAGGTGQTATLPSTLSFRLPSPPTPTITWPSTTRATDPGVPTTSEGTPTRVTGPTPPAGSVGGVDVDKLLVQLAADPLAVDAAATTAADPAALAALRRQVSDARAAGFAVTVVLIGRDVDDLATLADTIAQRTGTTCIAVSATHFAVSSKEFTTAQLAKAEDAATRAGGQLDAAATLVASLRAQRSAAGSPTTSR